MNLSELQQFIGQSSLHTFASINFGCRVNAAELNQLSQILVDLGLSPEETNPDIYLINTCAITKKGEYESIYKIKKLATSFPQSIIIATGCANLDKVSAIKNVVTLENSVKDKIKTNYVPQIKDKFSQTQRYLLKVQSGCTTNCTFCIVPSRRPTLNFLSIDDAVKTVNIAVENGYKEIIITGVNLAQYIPGLSNLVEALLTQTKIELISFGSIPILCIDDKFIKLLSTNHYRLSTFLHIPLQSCSNKILKLMHRPYTKERIIETFSKLKSIKNNISPSLSKRGLGGDLSFGTDIIVGFPTETNDDFQETYDLCKSIGFQKIHTFIYSPRPDTPARELFLNSPKLSKLELTRRSQQIRSLVSIH